jgi:hypothetical protein
MEFPVPFTIANNMFYNLQGPLSMIFYDTHTITQIQCILGISHAYNQAIHNHTYMPCKNINAYIYCSIIIIKTLSNQLEFWTPFPTPSTCIPSSLTTSVTFVASSIETLGSFAGTLGIWLSKESPYHEHRHYGDCHHCTDWP